MKPVPVKIVGNFIRRVKTFTTLWVALEQNKGKDEVPLIQGKIEPPLESLVNMTLSTFLTPFSYIPLNNCCCDN